MLSYYWSGVELESELESKCGKEENSMPIPTRTGVIIRVHFKKTIKKENI